MEMAGAYKNVLVTGATGYVGGRLVPLLLDSGFHVRVLVRDPDRLQGRSWLPRVEVNCGDVLRSDTLKTAMQGMDVAYYLIHSMGLDSDFSERDRVAALNFSNAAHQARLKRLIYLGGLGEECTDLSVHLRSRHEVGQMLRQSGIPVLEFRSAIIIGSGSASFELMRYVTEGMPIILCPRWVETRIQPISVRNVLDYLIAALNLSDEDLASYPIIEIGGADVLTYRDMMEEYARVRGLRRLMIKVPFLTTRMVAAIVHWLTPLPKPLGMALIQGLCNEVIVRGDMARLLFPQIQPRDYHTSLERALVRIFSNQVETTWSDSLTTVLGDVIPVTFSTKEGLLFERRQRMVAANPHIVFNTFVGLGGRRGWLYLNWIWWLRGVIDRLAGGVGFRRGRRHPNELRAGDVLDFWRVEAIESDRLLRLRAEMKVPGLAWLQFEAHPQPNDQTLLVQTAYFEPRGFFGLLYWYALYPIHTVAFDGLVREVGRRAERAQFLEASGASGD